jgi:hypothetical protein
VAENQWEFWLSQLTVHYVQIRATHCASPNFDEHLSWPGLRPWQIHTAQRFPFGFKNHCPHAINGARFIGGVNGDDVAMG